MPLRYDTEEEQEVVRGRRSSAALGHAVGTDTEIALGTRSLLAIFFGLVLICAVFFGLGYSVGRGSGARAAAQPSPDVPSPTPDSRLSKPSADQTLTPVEAPSAATNDGSAPSGENPGATPPQVNTPAPTPSSTAPATTTSAQKPAATPATATLQPAAATTTVSFMVQVAAVRVPQDAQILVDALKKHGYTAVVRNESQDQLLHIQLGPFTTRADAMAMRTKLLGDGYNAVVK